VPGIYTEPFLLIEGDTTTKGVPRGWALTSIGAWGGREAAVGYNPRRFDVIVVRIDSPTRPSTTCSSADSGVESLHRRPGKRGSIAASSTKAPGTSAPPTLTTPLHTPATTSRGRA